MQDENCQEVMLKLNDHENRLVEIARRVEQQEQQIKVIGELSLNVRELAVTMKSMVREQISHSERITRLERAPLSRYEKLIFSVLSAMAGALFGSLINIL